MEEKERYKLESYNEAFCQIHDTESDEWYLRKDLVKDLLNQQDKHIKKLEEENQQLKQQLAEKEKQIANIQHRLKVAEKALELACIEELREIGIYNDDLDYKKELSISKQQYLEQAEKEV